MRPCSRCKGIKITVREAFTYTDDRTGETRSYPRKESPCYACQGKGEFPEVDYAAIEKAIVGRKGLRSARPKDSRAYYVWRMARFHGGIDYRMPVMCDLELAGDPFKPELDKMADDMAKKYFGSDLKAALRWGKALGYLG